VTAVIKVRAIDTRGKTAAPLDTPTDLSAEAVREISAQLNAPWPPRSRSISRPRISTGM